MVNQRNKAQSTQEPKGRFIVLSEGECSEPEYLKSMIKDKYPGFSNSFKFFSLTDFKKNPDDEKKKDVPGKLMGEAKRRLNNEKTKDKIFIVCDVDRHHTYRDLIQSARDNHQKYKGRLYLFISNPCFESWVLLHYTESSKRYESTQGQNNSPCDLVKDDVKKYLQDYKKGGYDLHQKIKDLTVTARKNAEKNWKDVIKKSDDEWSFLLNLPDNPSFSMMFRLFDLLDSLNTNADKNTPNRVA